MGKMTIRVAAQIFLHPSHITREEGEKENASTNWQTTDMSRLIVKTRNDSFASGSYSESFDLSLSPCISLQKQ